MNYIATNLDQTLFVNSVISIHYFEYTTEFHYRGDRRLHEGERQRENNLFRSDASAAGVFQGAVTQRSVFLHGYRINVRILLRTPFFGCVPKIRGDVAHGIRSEHKSNAGIQLTPTRRITNQISSAYFFLPLEKTLSFVYNLYNDEYLGERS